MTGEQLLAAPACQSIVLVDCAYSEQWVSSATPIA
jgi:hypothetical protein